MKIGKNIAISLPIRKFTKEESMLLIEMLNKKYYIYWNGKDLRTKAFISNEFELVSEQIPVPAKVIRDLIEIKYLYNVKKETTNGEFKNFLVVNPFIENYYHKKINEKPFEVSGSEISVVCQYNFDVPYYYQEKGRHNLINKKEPSRTIAMSIYTELLKNTLIIPYIFKINDNYFTFKNGDIIEISSKFMNKVLDKKEKVKQELTKVVEQVENEKEDRLSSDTSNTSEAENLSLSVVDTILSESKDSSTPSKLNVCIEKDNNKYIIKTEGNELTVAIKKSLDTKFLRTIYKLLLKEDKINENNYTEYMELTNENNNLINENNKTYRQLSFIYRKQQSNEEVDYKKLEDLASSYSSNSIKIEKNKKVIDDLVNMYDSLVKENRDFSIKKLNLNYAKPISKLKIDNDASIGIQVAKMLDFIRKNTVTQISDEDLFNYLKNKASHYKFSKFEYYKNSDKLNDNFIKIFSSNYKGDLENVSFVLGTVIDNKPRAGLSSNMLFVIENNNQLGTWKTNMSYAIPKGYSLIDDEILENDFSKVSLYNINSLTYTDAIISELTSVAFFTDDELAHIRKVIGNYNYYGVKKVAEKIDRMMKYRSDAYAKEIESILKLKDTLDIYFINELGKEQSDKFKESSSSYARSFEDKKNINNYILKAMENNEFIGDSFKYVEIDNDVDLEQFKKVEENYKYLVDNKILPKLPEQIDLRFRKLGKMKAGSGMGVAGVYFPQFKTITIDISNEYSFIHEYGHALDYLNSYNQETLSKEYDFADIVKKYRENLRKNDSTLDYKDVAYYSEETEIFARGFELYIKNKFGEKARLLKHSYYNPEYEAFNGMKEELFSYFDDLFL